MGMGMGMRLYPLPGGDGDENGTKVWYPWGLGMRMGWISFTGMGMG